MASLESQDTNILDTEALNWRWIAYPLVGLIAIVICGFSLYYYLENQREQKEALARQAFLQAKTPTALVQVADEYSGTSHAALALIAAADLSFQKNDYPAAIQDYQRVIQQPKTDDLLRDSARVGLASVFEADNKVNDAIDTYLTVARRGDKSPYAPFAYLSAARLDEQKNDTADERKILTEAADLGSASPFVKVAGDKLKQLNLSARTPLPMPPISAPAPVPTPTH